MSKNEGAIIVLISYLYLQDYIYKISEELMVITPAINYLIKPAKRCIEKHSEDWKIQEDATWNN
jgi:hypothetical protein